MAEERELKLKITGETASAEAAVKRVEAVLAQLNRSAALQTRSLAQLNQTATQQTGILNTLAAASAKHGTALGAVTTAANQQVKALGQLNTTAQQQTTILQGLSAATAKHGAALTSISAQVNQAVAALQKLGAASQGAGQQSVAGTTAASTGFTTLVKNIAVAGAAYLSFRTVVGGTKALVSETFEQLDRGIKVDNITRAFESLEASAGLIADDQLQRLREATRGLIDDFTLMEKSNLWQTLRLAPDQFDELAGAAIKLGASVGRDAVQAINDLTVGLGRQSPRILDNLGIIVKAEEAQERYAAAIGKSADKLTDEERRTAFLTLAIERINEAAAKLPDPAENAGRAYERFGSALENAKNDFAQAVANSEPLAESLSELIMLITQTDWSSWGSAFADAAAAALDSIMPLLKEVRDWFGGLALVAEKYANKSDRARIANLQEIIDDAENPGFFGFMDNIGSASGYGTSRDEDRRRAAAARAEIAEIEAQMRGKDAFKKFEQELRAYQATATAAFSDFQKNVFGSLDIGEIDERAAEAARKAAEKAAKERIRAAERAAKEMVRINEKLAQDLAKIQASGQQEALEQQFKSAYAAGDTGAMSSLREAYRKSVADGIRAGYSDELAKGGAEAAAKIDQIVAAKMAEQATKATTAIKDKLTAFEKEVAGKRLSDQIEQAYKTGNLSAVPALLEQQKRATYQGVLSGYSDALLAGDDAARKAAENLANSIAEENDRIAKKKLEEQYKEAFRNSVEFFADIFTTTITGSSQDITEILADALKRVAIGFGAQIAASIAANVGLNLTGITSAQGLGQVIASSLGFEGGGVGTLGDIFGGGGAGTALTSSAVALDGSAAALTSAAGALTASAGSQALKPPGMPEIVDAQRLDAPGMETIVTKAGIVAAAVAATVITAKNGYDVFKAGQKGGVREGIKAGFDGPEDLLAAFASGGLSIPIQLAAGIIGGLTGGGTDPGELKRRALRGMLQELFGQGLEISTTQGVRSLFDFDYNVPDFNKIIGAANPWQNAILANAGSNPYLNLINGNGGNLPPSVTLPSGSGVKTVGDAAALVTPLAQLFVKQGIDSGQFAAEDFGVLSEQLAGIFTNAVSEAGNFNEVLINTRGLMAGLGLDAGEAKKQLAGLFLSGDIDLPQFGGGIQSLNLIGQTDLQGPTAEIDALNVAINNLDENRQVAAQGMLLFFKEIEESNIVSFFTDQLGPGISGSIQTAVTDGMISLQEFAQIGLESGDEVVQFFEQRFGGDVADAIKNGLSDGELSFDELVTAGVVSTDKLIEYVRQKYGQEAAAVLQGFAQAGVNSFEDINTALTEQNADVIFAIFNVFNAYKEGLQGVVSQNGELKEQAEISRKIGEGWKYAADEKERYNKALRNTPAVPAGGTGSGGSGFDPNRRLRPNPA